MSEPPTAGWKVDESRGHDHAGVHVGFGSGEVVARFEVRRQRALDADPWILPVANGTLELRSTAAAADGGITEYGLDGATAELNASRRAALGERDSVLADYELVSVQRVALAHDATPDQHPAPRPERLASEIFEWDRQDSSCVSCHARARNWHFEDPRACDACGASLSFDAARWRCPAPERIDAETVRCRCGEGEWTAVLGVDSKGARDFRNADMFGSYQRVPAPD